MNTVFPEISIEDHGTLSIDEFRKMDYLSVEKYKIPIELLMENAGLNLARLVACNADKTSKILIGVGIGNNGGGGLAAARRLAGWGYSVFLNVFDPGLKPLPAAQLERALAVGVVLGDQETPDIFIDAYLGFSQRLPLTPPLQTVIRSLNDLTCLKISLDIPTGFDKNTAHLKFIPDIVLTLAAMKTELLAIRDKTELFIADLGLPNSVYSQFGLIPIEEFKRNGIVKCK
ncbi:MAG: NAD(P)H-hydrate epimerase [Fidelibacterota bacterium]